MKQGTHGPQHAITGLRAQSFNLVAGMGSDNQDGGYGKGGPQVEPTISEPSSSPSFAAADSGKHWTLSGTNTVMFASSVKLHTAKYQLKCGVDWRHAVMSVYSSKLQTLCSQLTAGVGV